MLQTIDRISAYQTLNQVAEAAGVVLFGSTTAANLPLNELLQDFGVSCTVYNRSVEGLTIEQNRQNLTFSPASYRSCRR